MSITQIKQLINIYTFSPQDASKEDYKMSLPGHLMAEAKSPLFLWTAFH